MEKWKYDHILVWKYGNILIYIERNIDKELEEWARTSTRMPLLIRGARQVGKTTSIRNLAKKFDHFLELNLEDERKSHTIFNKDFDIKRISEELTALYDTPIIPGKTLLFFDEIQASTLAISSLRYFYEKLPDLHVISTGSLLEFALHELPSFGVGRIANLYMYPLSFDEFLKAMKLNKLLEFRKTASALNPLNEAIHNELNDLLKRYFIIGGMPGVVSSYAQTRNLKTCLAIQDNIIINLKTDFGKYKKKVPSLRIMEVFNSVVLQSGNKFVYNQVDSESNHKQIKEALELLILSGWVIPVTHTSANGIPIGAEVNSKFRKMLLLDTGLLQRLAGLNIADLLMDKKFEVINKGNIAEQFVGLEILKSFKGAVSHDLFFWQRENKNSQAEVDFLIQQGNEIIPIEVKAGKKGSMQSMYLFLKEKNAKFGVRCSLENYSDMPLIKIIPLYAIHDFISNLSDDLNSNF